MTNPSMSEIVLETSSALERSTLDISTSQDWRDADPFLNFPPEPLQAPFIYSARQMSLPPLSKHQNIAWIISEHQSLNRGYQELMHFYIHETATRLAAYSPCYVDLWRLYIPTMAFGPRGSGALLNAMVALAALQLAPLQRDPDRGRERARRYYAAALQDHHSLGGDQKGEADDAVLATKLLFAHFEVLLNDNTSNSDMAGRTCENGFPCWTCEGHHSRSW